MRARYVTPVRNWASHILPDKHISVDSGYSVTREPEPVPDTVSGIGDESATSSLLVFVLSLAFTGVSQ